MKAKNLFQAVLISCLLMFVSYNAFANNITVSNVRLIGQNTSEQTIMVKFNITWENSWRTSTGPSNWDAAWVFVKFRTGSDPWQHAVLTNTGHISPYGSTISTGLLNPASTYAMPGNPGMGAFIYRSANGTGTFSATDVQLSWKYGADGNGVPDNANVQVQVYAIEMVNVPQGAFTVGTGGTESGSFTNGSWTVGNPTIPLSIATENTLLVGASNGKLWYDNPVALPYSGDQGGPIPAAFPKGYNAFYSMKYEISQQGYVDFLNSITTTQAYSRYDINNIGYRYNITKSPANVHSTSTPNIACNFLSWADLAAYLDWSALRPMTELEFEKACRGTQTAVPNEFAWGNTELSAGPYTLQFPGAYNEIIATGYNQAKGNAAYNGNIGTIGGPLRVGIFSYFWSLNRVSSGATYYSIMDMSGNLYERTVTVGNTTGRNFTGTHGNGLLDGFGYANIDSWPGSDAVGAGMRGGDFYNGIANLGVSYRGYAAYVSNGYSLNYGGRGVRTSP
ncbi:MAG: SUMF1/EgtB/PvdO family nonheme iron enzyme [Ignavibacteriae bacterium]|nr:SUMF1/EgtB/PvdO family nonheme iron enzyme [Ignavibacteriota bacterium]